MLGFEPSYTTAQAFADFASSLLPGLAPARVRATEKALVGALTPGGGGRRG